MKWGIIVKIWVVIGGKRTIIGGRRGIIGTSSADWAPTDECSADAVGMHIIIYMATGDGRGSKGKWPEMALIIISRYDFTISGLDLCVAGCEIVVSFPKICLIVERKRIGMAAKFGMGGKRITQKAVASSDGSAIVAVAPMAAGKQVFLGAIITPPTVMQSMTSEDTTNKKRPTAVKKVRLAPVQKQLPREITSTRAENMDTTINTRQTMGLVGVGMGMLVASVGMVGMGMGMVGMDIEMIRMGMGMVGMGMGMLVASVGMVGMDIGMIGMDIGMIGMGVLVGMAQPSGNSVGVAFS